MPTDTADAGAPQLLVELRGIGKTFNGTPVLRDIDLVEPRVADPLSDRRPDHDRITGRDQRPIAR